MYQTVLLPVVQPVTGPAGPDDPLKLVGFHPDDFIDTIIAERRKTIIERRGKQKQQDSSTTKEEAILKYNCPTHPDNFIKTIAWCTSLISHS